MKNQIKSIATLWLIVASSFSLHAQTNTPPLLTWQKSCGGSVDDVSYCVKPTPDGGYIVAGSSSSNDGNITGSHGKNDYSLIKLNANGDIQWQRSYGGSGSDIAMSVVVTSDGGYAVLGQTSSKDGDVVGYKGGAADYWLVKTSSDGTIQWNKCYGGNKSDTPYSLQITSDNGFVMVGLSNSTKKDVTGTHGAGDAWIVKTDANGTLQWQKSVGGTLMDTPNDIHQTSDGGYIVAGHSLSNDNGITNRGEEDYWLFKLDASGNLLWQKTYGGSGGDVASAVCQTSDGGYAICGLSHSSDGDMVGNHTGHEVWIVKTDRSGNLVWEHPYGGSDGDNGVDVKQGVDGTIIALGYSRSTNGDVTGCHGSYDYWLIALNTSGNLLWQKTFGGSQDEYPFCLQITSSGQYIISGKSNSNDGDVTGNHGAFDWWVVKASPVVQ